MTDKQSNWREKADENTELWGTQPPEDVVLAIVEEVAEITEELFEHTDVPIERYNRDERYLLYLLTEITALGSEVQRTLEETYEDENGNPIPEDERPRILGEIEDIEAVMDEVDDLGPLVYQLRDSVEEHSRW
jgi:hypothetical protein